MSGSALEDSAQNANTPTTTIPSTTTGIASAQKARGARAGGGGSNVASVTESASHAGRGFEGRTLYFPGYEVPFPLRRLERPRAPTNPADRRRGKRARGGDRRPQRRRDPSPIQRDSRGDPRSRGSR